MRIRASSALPLALIVFLAALTLWLQYAVQAPGSETARRHDPDLVVDNFTVKRLGGKGRPEYTLSAPKMLHYPDDDTSEVLSPRLVHFGDDGANIIATADRGLISRNGEEGFLYGNVLVVRAAMPGQEELRARTDFLHVMNEKKLARTDKRVTITQGNSTLTGVGMELSKDKREFRLFSQVRGTYEPRRN